MKRVIGAGEFDEVLCGSNETVKIRFFKNSYWAFNRDDQNQVNFLHNFCIAMNIVQ